MPVGFRASLVQRLGFAVLGLGALAMMQPFGTPPGLFSGAFALLFIATAVVLSVLAATLVLRRASDPASVLTRSLIAFPLAGALAGRVAMALFELLSAEYARAVFVNPTFAPLEGIQLGASVGMALGVAFLVPLLALEGLRRRPSRIGTIRVVGLFGLWLVLVGAGSFAMSYRAFGMPLTLVAIALGVAMFGIAAARLRASRAWLAAVERGDVEGWALHSVLDVDPSRNLAWWERGPHDTPRAVLCRVEATDSRAPYRGIDTLVHPTALLR